MAGGQPREGAEGAAGGAPALGRGPGPGARAALGFRGGDVVMTPRGRRAKVAGCVHGPGGSRLWAEYLGAFPPRCHLSLVSRLQRSSSPPPRHPAPGWRRRGGREYPISRPSVSPAPSLLPPPQPSRARAVPCSASTSPSISGRRFQMHEAAPLARKADPGLRCPRRRT